MRPNVRWRFPSNPSFVCKCKLFVFLWKVFHWGFLYLLTGLPPVPCDRGMCILNIFFSHQYTGSGSRHSVVTCFFCAILQIRIRIVTWERLHYILTCNIILWNGLLVNTLFFSTLQRKNCYFKYEREGITISRPRIRGEDPILAKNRIWALYLKRREIFKSLLNEYFR